MKVCISRVANSLGKISRFENVANCRVADCRSLFDVFLYPAITNVMP